MSKSYYVKMPLSHYKAICNKIRELLSMEYVDIPLIDNESTIIVDDDDAMLSDHGMQVNSAKVVTTTYTSDQIPALIHKIGRGAS